MAEMISFNINENLASCGCSYCLPREGKRKLTGVGRAMSRGNKHEKEIKTKF